MSATMFITRNDHNTLGMDHSRIPISTSPLPLRRSHSLRLRGEKLSQHIRFSDCPSAKQNGGKQRRPQNMGCTTPLNGTAHTLSGGVGNDLREARNLHSLSRKVVDGCNHVKTDFRSSSTPKGVPSPHAPRAKTLVSCNRHNLTPTYFL